MTKRKVISRKNLPTRMPIALTIALGLLLDRCAAPGWVWGVAGTLMAVVWVAVIFGMFTEDDVEVLK
ncbi:MAG: hypothetical protein J0I15_07200 [Herbaspirillum huttiense]|uniref:hypothetical protein n=1 Tax=Herbaspirillum huttiense TaxID=863372 RepID=UPI001AC58779|nr:hypothetical protein [Herbaspirillum huttiense]MBN9356216.1 hypothetical protein [Herbaspirillum huttiense]